MASVSDTVTLSLIYAPVFLLLKEQLHYPRQIGYLIIYYSLITLIFYSSNTLKKSGQYFLETNNQTRISPCVLWETAKAENIFLFVIQTKNKLKLITY